MFFVLCDLCTYSSRLLDIGITCPIVGIGSTPSCSQPPETLPGINEFHPGNYIFYGVVPCCALVSKCMLTYTDLCGLCMYFQTSSSSKIYTWW